jgi:hypothetical protein
LKERLPSRIEARREIALHAVREAIYGVLFGASAWSVWYGRWGFALVMLFIVVVLVDAADEWVENRTRVLPQNERILHFLMTVNLGLIAAAMGSLLFVWTSHPTAIHAANYGIRSWLLSALAFFALVWAVRDTVAWFRLGSLR